MTSPNEKKWERPYYIDYVGRRRKLPAVYIREIMDAYAAGEKVRVLAERYSVSESTIRIITYHTKRK